MAGGEISMSFRRQLGILNPKEIIFPITVIGVGGIGRAAAETLAEMGCPKMTLIDPDKVETHNRPNQVYRKSDIGRLKVEAAKEIIEGFAEWCKIETIAERFVGQIPLKGIVVSAVDSIETRKEIWQFVHYNVNVPLFIDGRLGGQFMQVFTVKPCQIEDIERYEETLFPKERTAHLPCTAQQIIYVGKIIGGLIALQFKKWLKKESYNLELALDLADMTLLLDKKLGF